MRIEILSGTYEIDNEARAFVTAAEETALAALSQKLVIRQRRQAEQEERQKQKEQERLEQKEQKEQERLEKQRQKEQSRIEKLREKERLKEINLSRILSGLPPIHSLAELNGEGTAQ